MEENKIRLFVPTFNIEECLSEIRECLEIGWTGSGFKTEEFEKSWSEYTQLENSLFINSNSVGLLIALESLKIDRGWNDGDEVITTPLTFVSTNHAILQSKLDPVFCDIDHSLNLNPESVEKAITKKTRALMFVGIGGNPANYNEILEICKKHNIALILDAAHMVGTRNENAFIGREADFVVSSFQAVKNLPTADSGMLNSPDDKLMALARKLSWLGISTSTYERNSNKGGYKWEYDVDHIGYKANGNSIMAAIALVQLKKLKADNEFRQSVSLRYMQGLANIDGIEIVDHDENNYVSARHLFQIRILKKSREATVQKMNELGVDVGVHYRLNTRYKPYTKFRAETPKAIEIEPQLLSLPLHMRLTNENVEQVIKSVEKAVE